MGGILRAGVVPAQNRNTTIACARALFDPAAQKINLHPSRLSRANSTHVFGLKRSDEDETSPPMVNFLAASVSFSRGTKFRLVPIRNAHLPPASGTRHLHLARRMVFEACGPRSRSRSRRPHAPRTTTSTRSRPPSFRERHSDARGVSRHFAARSRFVGRADKSLLARLFATSDGHLLRVRVRGARRLRALRALVASPRGRPRPSRARPILAPRLLRARAGGLLG